MRMSKTAKVIAIITIVVLVLGTAAGIIVAIASYDPDNPSPGFYLDGSRIQDPGTMLTLGSHTISYNEYRYFYLTQKYYLSMGDVTYWDDDPDGTKQLELKEETEASLREMYAWLDLATEKGIGLSQEEQDQILADVEEEKRMYGTEFGSRLRQNYLADEAIYIHITEMQTLVQKVQTAYNEEALTLYEDEAMETIVTAQHILLSFDTAAEDPAANEEETLERIEAILQTFNDNVAAAEEAALAEMGEGATLTDEESLAIRTEAFDALVHEYNEDPGQETLGHYTFGDGTMVTEFYESALALEAGQVSTPVRTSYGYHLILRLPLDMDDFEADRDNLLGTATAKIANEKIQERADALALTPGQYYDLVSTTTVK